MLKLEQCPFVDVVFTFPLTFPLFTFAYGGPWGTVVYLVIAFPVTWSYQFSFLFLMIVSRSSCFLIACCRHDMTMIAC